MTIDVGDVVGDYEVLASLGAGGVGHVYKVRHRITGRVEALKILLPDHAQDGEQTERFLREVKVQANLSHPNIASILNAFHVGNNLAMVMECVQGESLDKLIARGRLPLTQVLGFALQALAALSYAHARGVIHRDVKPENMLITPSGTLKVTDFGLAKIATDTRLTVTGATLGSLYYMSPEQVNGVPTLDERSDVYSMGIVLYELALGRRPFQGEQPFHLMLAHVEQQPRPPTEIDPSLPASLSDAILKALGKRPETRFQSTEEFRRAVEAASEIVPGSRGHLALSAHDQMPSPSPRNGLAADAEPVPQPALAVGAARGTGIKRPLVALPIIVLAVLLAVFIVWRIARPDPTKTVAVASGSHQLLRKVVPGGTVRAAVLSAGGLTAVLTDRGVVELWEPVSGEKRATFSDADQRGTALALSPDGRVIAFLSEDSRLRLGDVGTGEERMQLDVGRAVRSVAVSNDGGLIAVASDRFVTVWEVDGARRKEPLHRQELSARLVTFHPGGNAVAFAAKNSVRVQSLPDAGETSPVSVSGGAVTALAFNSQKDLLAAAGKNELKIWNTGTLEEVLSANLPGDPWALGFMRSGSCIALTSAGQLAQIWNAVDGTEVSSFLHDHDVKAATLSADGRFAATATTAGDLWIWKADVAWDQPSAKPQRNILRRFVDVFRGGKKRRQEKQSR